MGFATKKKAFALTLASILITAHAGTAASMQVADAGNPPPGNAAVEAQSYFSKHFSANALSADVKAAVVNANLTPVSFNKITVHTRDQVTSSGQGNPTTYTVSMVLENAGQGLLRRVESVQSHDGNTMTRLDLMYRGYFPFLSQSIPANANALPPVMETRKVMRFDTRTDGHMNFTYLYGPSGQATFADPGQVICDSGKGYSASELNPAIQGQALELSCQNVDTNGIVTDKMKFAYLQKYAVAVMLHTQNSDSSLDSTIVDFTVE
jgi:hypothetical protein